VTVSYWRVCLAGVLAFCCCGCGDSHESVAREMLAAQKELCAILDGVKDDSSAREAVTRLDLLAGKMQSLQLRSTRLGSAPTEINNALHTKYDVEFRETTEAIQLSYKRLDPVLAEQLKESLDRITALGGR